MDLVLFEGLGCFMANVNVYILSSSMLVPILKCVFLFFVYNVCNCLSVCFDYNINVNFYLRIK